MSLLEECIEALQNSSQVVSGNKKTEIQNTFNKTLPLTSWGRINWALLNNKLTITEVQQVVEHLKKSEKDVSSAVYIIWDEASLPVIKSDFNTIVSHLDDVTAVSFDTWLYCPSEGWVLEFYHDGEITLGFV